LYLKSLVTPQDDRTISSASTTSICILVCCVQHSGRECFCAGPGSPRPMKPEVRALEPQGATLRRRLLLFATRARSLEAGYVYNLHSQSSGGLKSRQPTAKSRDQGLMRVANLAFCTYVDTTIIKLELEELEEATHRAPVLSRALAKQRRSKATPIGIDSALFLPCTPIRPP
jgi:hypothetical protein